jgi:hypothetical protein
MDVSEYKTQREQTLSQKSPDDVAKQLTNSNK